VPTASGTFALDEPVDLRMTMRAVAQGGGDPALRVGTAEVWRASRTPDGPVTLRLRSTGGSAPRTQRIRADAWGPGARWAVAQAPELVGGGDVLEGFEVLARRHPLVWSLHRRHLRLRLPHTRRVFEAMVPTICAQKVTGIEAKRSYRGILRAWGEPAPAAEGVPGAPRLVLPPAPSVLASQPSWRFHELGLERKRAETLLRVAACAARLEEASALPDRADARRRLRSVPGVGVWTSAEVALVAFGDADAVSVGDYHLKNVASWHLAGEPRGTDERMLELLEPFRPHRGRVLRLLELAGGAPRFGPRMPLRAFEAQ
jgi:3-methyladenine DNA glycosylase/8-oxoguanine DNA glycosylase